MYSWNYRISARRLVYSMNHYGNGTEWQGFLRFLFGLWSKTGFSSFIYTWRIYFIICFHLLYIKVLKENAKWWIWINQRFFQLRNSLLPIYDFVQNYKLHGSEITYARYWEFIVPTKLYNSFWFKGSSIRHTPSKTTKIFHTAKLNILFLGTKREIVWLYEEGTTKSCQLLYGVIIYRSELVS